MNYQLTAIDCPTGVYTLVGSIPLDLCIWRKATRAGICGMRSMLGADGRTQVTPISPLFGSKAEAIQYAAERGYVCR